jgi:hypothetical protein
MAIASSGKTYACFGCIDFAHNERTLTYYRWACANNMFPVGCTPRFDELCFCPDDTPVLPDAPFVDPITDEVCWYDPAIPESSEFLGVIILKVSGLRSSTFSREVGDGFLEGSILLRPKRRGKAFGFEVLLVATSCEGMDYGREWLRGILEEHSPCGTSSCESCAGRQLLLRTHCAEDAVLDDGLHLWNSVGLVDGYQPTDNSGHRTCCCVLESGTFTMQSESQYSFSQTGIVECEQDADPAAYVRCYNWLEDCLTCPDDCCDKCGFDALCTCFPPLPVEPEIITDQCFCTPLAKIIQCCCVSGIPHGYDSTFKIDIYSGTDWSNDDFKQYGMRDYTLKIFDNPAGLPCITDDDSYQTWCDRANPCIELQVAYIPEDSTLTIDGRTGRVTLNCLGRCLPFDRVVSTASGGPVFPLTANCLPVMICSEHSYYGSQLQPAAAGILPSSVTVTRYLRFRN